MALNEDSAKNNEILKNLDKGYEGFTDASDKDYDIVRKLIAPLKQH